MSENLMRRTFQRRSPSRASSGFTALELMVTLAVAGIIGAMAMSPARNYMASWDSRATLKNVVSQLVMARMRAASNFSWAQVSCVTTTTPQTCQVQVNQTGTNNTDFSTNNSDNKTWGAEPLARTMHIVAAGTAVGSITVGAGGQAGTTPTAYTTVIFNSRGMPISASGNGVLKSDYAIYLYSDLGTYWAITVELSGHPRIWMWSGTGWTETDSLER
jgi:prepilin-type N-terminal cleavage/methylation domain-containing protein